MIKKFLTLGALLILIQGTFSSCSKGGSDSVIDNDYFDISPGKISFKNNDKSQTVNIDSNCSWEISVSQTNWPDLKVSPVSGTGKLNDLRITSDVNTTTSPRSAKLEVTFGSKKIKKSFEVTQEAGETKLIIEESVNGITLSENGDKKSFTVVSNVTWKVDSKPEWCELDKTTGSAGTETVFVSASDNPYTTPQTGTIKISGGGKYAEISVAQLGKDYSLRLGTDNVKVDARGGEDMSKTFTVTCNGSWSTTVKHDDGGSWCSVSPSYGGATGSNPLNVKVICQPNYSTSPRNATIQVIAGNSAKEASVKVEQQAATYPVFSGIPACRENSSTKQEVTISFTSMFEVTECGFCLGTESQPTKRYKIEGVGGTSGTIKMELDVEEGMTYYVRAYAVSPVGEKINYSEETTFETKGKQPGKNDNESPRA